MALLHQSLYRSGVFASADLNHYLRLLATQAFSASLIATTKVALKFDFSRVYVEMDQALLCGLIINELISNSLKRGFAEGCAGEIVVSVKSANAWVEFGVRDTGVGLPQNFAVDRNAALGLHLVQDLVGQLRG